MYIHTYVCICIKIAKFSVQTATSATHLCDFGDTHRAPNVKNKKLCRLLPQYA